MWSSKRAKRATQTAKVAAGIWDNAGGPLLAPASLLWSPMPLSPDDNISAAIRSGRRRTGERPSQGPRPAHMPEPCQAQSLLSTTWHSGDAQVALLCHTPREHQPWMIGSACFLIPSRSRRRTTCPLGRLGMEECSAWPKNTLFRQVPPRRSVPRVMGAERLTPGCRGGQPLRRERAGYGRRRKDSAGRVLDVPIRPHQGEALAEGGRGNG